jgi:hypothetical protein
MVNASIGARSRKPINKPVLGFEEAVEVEHSFEWNVLVVSPRLDHRNCLLQAFEKLPVNHFSVTTQRQAKEMLAALAFEIVICDEKITDGSYRDVLSIIQSKHKDTRFIVMLSQEEQDEDLDAMLQGARSGSRAFAPASGGVGPSKGGRRRCSGDGRHRATARTRSDDAVTHRGGMPPLL